MSNVVLETEGLTKSYGSLTAVKDLTLQVYEGEVFGFLGPNGAGKTTSINMMCGLLRPDAGHVTVKGVPIREADDQVRSRVGVCPQDIVLWERLTCLEQLQFIGQMYGLSGRKARQRGLELLEELDLVDKQKVQARKLSGGMQRRLNLAMALVHNPEIVVLDEPEAGLDPQSRIKVREYIQSLARKKTVILTTHNMDEADRVADRVAIIDHGELLVLDTPEALKQSVGEGDVVEIDLAGLAGKRDQLPAPSSSDRRRLDGSRSQQDAGGPGSPIREPSSSDRRHLDGSRSQQDAGGPGSPIRERSSSDRRRLDGSRSQQDAGGPDNPISEKVLQAVRPLVSQTVGSAEAVRLEEARGLLAVRALNAVGALPAILSALEPLDLQVGDVRVRKNTLEDVFIRLTGRRLRE